MAVYAALLKWLLLQAAQEEPPVLILQFSEPWTWSGVTPPDLVKQLDEPWTWESVDFGDIYVQKLEKWSS